ncbi:labda-7,13-dienyl diphosphate synthase [Streptomyces sp. CA-181903]|uniref:labda-7,13-dienyl diphosphate synthase n=1 Tax=Streptomyces sp. CA-181903 TaxID=3240055 RepID=UPI003D9049FF
MNHSHRRPAYDHAVTKLIRGMEADTWGRVRPSCYETARVVALAPRLPGHDRRLEWLLDSQHPQGTWGEGHGPYRLVPTLSAVDALLTVLQQHEHCPDARRERYGRAVAEGVRALRRFPTDGAHPDTVAVEVIVPKLIATINSKLERWGAENTGRYGTHPVAGLPYGMDGDAPARLVGRLAGFHRLPSRVWHSYEILGDLLPATAPAPGTDGLIGGSPAATAAWLRTRSRPEARREAALAALNGAADRYDGLLPEVIPLTPFERLWVLSALLPAGLPDHLVPTARAWVTALYDRRGVAGIPGLEPDADDSAVALYLAVRLGIPCHHDVLRPFATAHHFACYAGESTPSVTANAHALRALAAYARRYPGRAAEVEPMRRTVRHWLVERQQPEGYWTDKWHASPFYATARCVTALAEDAGPTAISALKAATAWAEATQHADGSWGALGEPTAEETSYGAGILLSAAPSSPCLDRAASFFATMGETVPEQRPALWHDKSLYAPEAVLDAEILATRERLRTAAPGA